MTTGPAPITGKDWQNHVEPRIMAEDLRALEQGIKQALDGGGGGGSGAVGITADDTPAAPAEGQAASYLVSSAVTWPAGLVWSTDPDGGTAPTITGTALVSLFTVGGTTRAIMGATFPALSAPLDTTAPSIPTGLTATATGSTTVNLAWSASTDAVGVTGYEYRIGSGSAVDAGAGLTETVTGLTASTLYSFTVRAYDAAGNRSGWSTAATVTTDAPPADTTPPTVGTMAASAITETGFTLTVSGASDAVGLHATPYAFTTNGGTDWAAYQASPVYVASGLTAATGYSCNWRVRDAAGNVSTGTAQTVTTESAYAYEVLADSPLGYWRLDETSGLTIGDSSGLSHPFTSLNGNYTRGAVGAIPGNAAIATVAALGSLSDATWLDVSALTVEALIKTTATSIGTVLRRDTNNAPNRIFMFRMDADGTMTMASWAGSTLYSATSTVTVNDGLWHHVVGVADGATTKVYIDGVEAASVASGPLQVGDAALNMFAHMGGVDPFIGTLDEVAMYGAALSPERIAVHASAAGI